MSISVRCTGQGHVLASSVCKRAHGDEVGAILAKFILALAAWSGHAVCGRLSASQVKPDECLYWVLMSGSGCACVRLICSNSSRVAVYICSQ